MVSDIDWLKLQHIFASTEKGKPHTITVKMRSYDSSNHNMDKPYASGLFYRFENTRTCSEGLNLPYPFRYSIKPWEDIP